MAVRGSSRQEFSHTAQQPLRRTADVWPVGRMMVVVFLIGLAFWAAVIACLVYS
jgi:hypothetical protein